MPGLFGIRWSRADAAGRPARARRRDRLVTLGDGLRGGVGVLEFRTGGGFSFDVLVDRSFDVGRCELGGLP
jgi:hypothetical protein